MHRTRFIFHRAKPKDGLVIAQFLNDDLASVVKKYPKNYIGFFVIPMQSPELAVDELTRIKKSWITQKRVTNWFRILITRI